jgi:two-component system response regulator HydG
VGLAVDALKKGAVDFLEKEGDPQLTRHVVERALEQARLRKEVELLHRQRLAGTKGPQIVADSAVMRRLLATVDEFARSEATVLFQGETGTGKSLLAEFVHYASPRADGPLVTINCGAIPKELIESELFGYADGAFTGARQQGKMGLIERADGGTLLLDEIGDLSLELQSKLLHVLETREFIRVGAVEPTRVDVRFVAATNADLTERIADGRFRRDLYYRLNVATATLPPLRDRKDDIPALARHFVQRLAERYGKAVHALTPQADEWLVSQPWPGNARELRNVIERALLLLRSNTLDETDLRCAASPDDLDCRARGSADCTVRLQFGQGDLLAESTRQVVLQAWERSGFNQSQAARLLGIPRTTFQTYVQKYGL